MEAGKLRVRVEHSSANNPSSQASVEWGGGVGSLKHLLKRYDTTVDPVIGEKVIVQDVATKQWKKTAIVTGIRLVADKTIASYEIDINGLETTNS